MSELGDVYTGISASETIRKWTIRLDSTREDHGGVVSQFWILGRREQVTSFEAELIPALGFTGVEELSVGENESPHEVLMRESARLIELEPRRIVVKLDGFERKLAQIEGFSSIQRRHHWDQDILEQNDASDTPLRDLLFNRRKQLVCVSRVLKQNCKEGIFEEALRTTSASGRKSGIVRFSF